mmetsp:Transcript_32224/g.58277  ORF Transcript_32224/g.58277 Transcript_32224/m.58277 type:complete len:255 (+) Transcript_32224:152-916(+)
MTAIHKKHDAQIAAAQARFMQAVSQAITKLINECGYSRERAIAALLRELGRGDGGLLEQDEEHVFDTMTTFSLGVEDASHALVVSRALQRLMKERSLSAVEAIDDLSSKLNTTKLISCGQDSEEPSPASSRPSSPQLQRATPTPHATMSTDRASSALSQQQQRKGRKVATTAKTKNAKKAPKNNTCCTAKNSLRKRPNRERADSVTQAVEQKAKKARLSPEESEEAADSSTNIVVRTKRNSASLQQDQVQSNVV